MFQVKLDQDHTTGCMWLQASHNGAAWSTIELRSTGEAIQIVSVLERAIFGKSVHKDHAFNCILHDGYGPCNCDANLRSD
jgi:hypothetical protein